MLRNYFKPAFRHMQKHRAFAFINIAGLAIGMASSILIFLWVKDEISYDDFHPRHIYRLVSKVDHSDQAVTSFPMAHALEAEVPGIRAAVRLSPTNAIFSIGTQRFDEKRVYYADSSFFRVFSFPMADGDAGSALSRPDGVLLTESTSKKYFGEANPMGKTIQVDNDIKKVVLTVTGVLKDIPGNSHLHFDILLPMALYTKSIDFRDGWDHFGLYTYLRFDDHFLSSPMNMKRLESRIDEIYKTGDPKTNASFSLQPLSDIHLRSRLLGDIEGQGNIQYVNIFSVVAIFILLIACINFINLSTALSGYRAKEVGVRKVLGAARIRLVLQFIGESMLMAFIALVIALAAAWLLLPSFNNLSGKQLSLQFFDARSILILMAVTLWPGMVAAIYPALVLSGFKPLNVLKGLKVRKDHIPWLRNGLVVFQFAISIILIISAAVVNSQLHFIFNRDTGFEKENLVYIKMPPVGDLLSNTQALQSTLRLFPRITDYTIISDLPDNLTRQRPDIDWPGKDPKLQVIVPNMLVDEHFLKTFKIGMLAGRSFSGKPESDENNYLVNETALKMMNIQVSDAVGKQLSYGGRKGEIIGVVKDFNFKPVHQPIEPLLLRTNRYGGYLVLRVRPDDLQKTIAQLEQVFHKVYPIYPFSYGFLDEQLAKLYSAEKQMGRLLNAFSFLSIFISCMGLFGLAAFTAQSRTREIGIRKVIGATTPDIVGMLTKDFLKPVVVAMVLSFPLSWWLMSGWLQNFAYHTGVDWWIFVLAGLLTMFIAIATISVQAIRAALSNAVDSLRAE